MLAEEGLPKLICADHNGTGWGHFDQPGQETWRRDKGVVGIEVDGYSAGPFIYFCLH